MIAMEKIRSHQALEERRMALEHEREMAKIRLAESRLRFQQEKLHVEAAAYGQPQNGGGDDNGNNDNEMHDNFEDIPNADDMWLQRCMHFRQSSGVTFPLYYMSRAQAVQE